MIRYNLFQLKFLKKHLDSFFDKLFSNRPNPRWMVIMVDSVLVLLAFLLAFLLRFNFNIPQDYVLKMWSMVPVLLSCKLFLFLVFRTYSGTVRHSGFSDLIRILGCNASASLIFMGIDIIFSFLHYGFPIPISVIIIDFTLSTLGMITTRLTVKYVYKEFTHWGKGKIRTAIIGSREQALLIKRALELDHKNNYQIIAIFDFHKINAGIDLNGIRTFHLNEYRNIIPRINLQSLIIPKGSLPIDLKTEIVDYCLDNQIKLLILPNIRTSLSGQKPINELRDISLEDLLEREPIKLDFKGISDFLNNKTILITGAAGSIGSEIVRQVMKFEPKQILLLDQAETPLFQLDLELRSLLKSTSYELIIGDVTNKEKMMHIFGQYRPDVVYHAAAYKHVPMMELNPYEAIQTNVMGTKIIADCASKFGSAKFIMISTDKAVNPTNVMGASKRIAEMYVQAFTQISHTKFITTRFGNVLGSNGSVIPLFKQQIEKGGPVTVTHPEITRYFMTIPEACQLVLEASSMGAGGEVYMFDMGKSVRIVDLARNMIRLAGLVPEIDIPIKFVGLRPGEKLYEELLYDKESAIPTHHPKITIAMVEKYDFLDISTKINSLVFSLKTNSEEKIVRMMKDIVPEYISNNSIFCALDAQDTSV